MYYSKLLPSESQNFAFKVFVPMEYTDGFKGGYGGIESSQHCLYSRGLRLISK